jgi:hypothetical protein
MFEQLSEARPVNNAWRVHPMSDPTVQLTQNNEQIKIIKTRVM